jgi:hypothetical protein
MSTERPEAIPAPRARVSRVGAVLSLLGAAAAIAGGVLLWRAGEGTVETIRVTKHSMLPDSLVGSPDLYLMVGTSDKQEIQTEGYEDKPIGNGLDFRLPKPLELKKITHIELMDEDVGSDDIRDRVDVSERICKGQDYQFELIGPEDPQRTRGITALAAGGVVFIIGAILVARSLAL